MNSGPHTPPGDETRLLARSRLARSLSERGEHGAALELYLSCFDAGSSVESGFRNAFVLVEIAELGVAHPPALAALRQRRDAREEAILEGACLARGIEEYAALNDVLREPERSLSAFDRVLESQPRDSTLVQRLADLIAPVLRARRRYAELRELAGRNVWFLRREIGLAEIRRAAGDGELRRTRALEEGGLCYEAALGLGLDEEAEQIAAALVGAFPDRQTYARLIDASVSACRRDAARSWVLRAARKFTPNDVERLRRRLPGEQQ